MTAFVALLRGVNVGGRTTVPMARLKAIAEDLGLEAPRTLLQSGNLVFRTDRTDVAALERALEAAIADAFGYGADVLLRDASTWEAAMAANPFAEAARRDPGHTLLMALREPPTAAAAAALAEAATTDERAAVVGAHAYLVFPAGISKTKLTNVRIERLLGTRGTARNWNTVEKIAAALRGAPRAKGDPALRK
jgi:uncharacterized protein (DUF1697 family)